MSRGTAILAGAAVVLYVLYQQGVSDVSGVADPAETNADGSAASGTDAGVIDEVQVALNLVPDWIGAWADAITVHEGWHVGSRSFRNNNPGNLEVDGDLGRDAGGYGIFSSYNAGRNALTSDLVAKARKYSVWTLYAVMARYAPPKENNTQAYAAAVAAALGVSTVTQVQNIPAAWASAGRSWVPVAFQSSTTTGTADASADSTSVLGPDTLDFSDPSSVSDAFTQILTGLDPSTIDLGQS